MPAGMYKRNPICKRGHNKDISGRYGFACKVCAKEYSARPESKAKSMKWAKDNPQKARKSWLVYNSKKRGIKIGAEYFSEVDYDRAYQIQQGKCPGCHKHQSELPVSLNIDHNHTTGQFRGLLCGNCNRILGIAKDNQQTLENLKVYLEKTNGK